MSERSLEAAAAARTREHFDAELVTLRVATTRLFAVLLPLQWAAAVGFAVLVAPYTWAGAERSVHPHVRAAVLLGGLTISVPVLLAVRRPAWGGTRHAVATAQMLIGAILIHLSGGRLETHFHVFGSLAFLAFYRDWKVLVTGSTVVAVDHIVRGVVWPESLYGVPGGAGWRWVEHAAWVVFEDAFLVVAIRQGLREMDRGAGQWAALERTNEVIERTVRDRTAALVARTQELKASETRFRTLFEEAIDGIFLCGDRGAILDVNRRGCASLGYTRDELLRLTIPDIDVDVDAARLAALMAPRRDHRQTTVDGRQRRKDGSLFPVEVRVSWFELDGHETSLAIVRDVTERTKAEARFRGLLESAPDAVVIVDDRGRIVLVNSQTERLFGYPRGELLARPVEMLTPDRFRGGHPSFRDVYSRTPQDRRPGGGTEWFGRRRDGSEFPIEMSLSPLETDDEVLVSSSIRDITARKRAESALRENEERYRLLFEANPHPMWVTDAGRRRFLAVNDAAVRQYGYARAVFLAMPVTTLDPPDGSAAAPPGAKAKSCRHRHRSGTVRDVEVAVSAIRFGGQPAHLTLAVDVTERMLLEVQLRQAQKLESIGQLAAGIAHEINTPIQYIGDNTAFLGDAFRDLAGVVRAYETADGPAAPTAAAADTEYLLAEVPRAIDQTLEGVRHVARIVAAMKEFAHPGSDVKAPVDLNRAILTVLEVTRNEWKYAADAVPDLAPDLPPVPALAGELNQVFLNLIVNAAHAIRARGHAGKGTLRVRTRNVPGGVEVRVGDDGSGIPEAIRGKIFDPFFTTKPVGQGTGQGLAIAHTAVVQRHGGSLTFESEVGVGTTFVVRLPVGESTPAAVADPPRIPEPEGAAP